MAVSSYDVPSLASSRTHLLLSSSRGGHEDRRGCEASGVSAFRLQGEGWGVPDRYALQSVRLACSSRCRDPPPPGEDQSVETLASRSINPPNGIVPAWVSRTADNFCRSEIITIGRVREEQRARENGGDNKREREKARSGEKEKHGISLLLMQVIIW